MVSPSLLVSVSEDQAPSHPQISLTTTRLPSLVIHRLLLLKLYLSDGGILLLLSNSRASDTTLWVTTAFEVITKKD
jgi:hypothetical protein